MDFTLVLPGDLICHIISLTTPQDACSLSGVCPRLKSFADDDKVWKKFLPPNYRDIIANLPQITYPSKKDLYLQLSDNPVYINNDTMIFALGRGSGKTCYMLGAKSLHITGVETTNNWMWVGRRVSRFHVVAQLRTIWRLEIEGRIQTNVLSSNTHYAAYLVFMFIENRSGFANRPVEFGVYLEGSDNNERREVVLDPQENMPQLPRDRGDGWMEIEMGEFLNENRVDRTLVCSLLHLGDEAKRGIIVEGIEVRPINSLRNDFNI